MASRSSPHFSIRNTRGFAWAVPLVMLALSALGVVVLKPKWMHGDSKRAQTAAQTTEALVAAGANQTAKASAVFVKIGETNAEAPDSPQKRVISRFVPIGLSFTGEPDPAFMLELEKLKTATLQGKVDQADKINAVLMQDAAATRLQLARAVADKRASDDELQRVAAERLGAERTQNILILVVVSLAGLYLYTKFTHTSPWALAKAITDMRNPAAAEQNAGVAAIDAATTPLQQMMVRWHTKLLALFARIFGGKTT